MGADETQIRATLARLVDDLVNPYRDRMKRGAEA
jgi:hypothetical protein